MKDVRYLGGPLDGQQAVKGHGKWSIYRTDTGAAMRVDAGDRVFGVMGSGSARRQHGYELTTVETVNGTEDVYRHATH